MMDHGQKRTQGKPRQDRKDMNPRLKKFIGTLFMVVFVALYAVVVVAIAPRILTGASKMVELAFYAIAGLAWALPLMPLIWWMEKKKAG